MNRDEMIGRIKAAKQEAQKAGKCHRRDLQKFVRRMEKEVRTYDHYRRNALLDERDYLMNG